MCFHRRTCKLVPGLKMASSSMSLTLDEKTEVRAFSSKKNCFQYLLDFFSSSIRDTGSHT